MSKIFVQIASYRDPELRATLSDMLKQAKNPENLNICIAWQYSEEDSWDNLDEYLDDKRFTILKIPYQEAKGACWARNQIQQKYKGEKYTLQLDSHHRFEKNWDKRLKDMYENLRKDGFEKPLLTGYIPSYEPSTDPKGRTQVPWKMHFDRFAPCGVLHTRPGNMDNFKEMDEPQLGRFYSAHFAFTTGKFCKEVQHDPEYYFHGEEITIGVRAFTWGYDIFHPHEVLIWHQYTREGSKKHWDDSKDWVERDKRAYTKVCELLGVDRDEPKPDYGEYGLGSERTLRDWETYSGIRFSTRQVQQDTLDFKVPPNVYKDEATWEAGFVSQFKHCLDVYKGSIPKYDYDFWVIAFKDENDKDIIRLDANKEEVDRLQENNPDDQFYRIWREFETSKVPYKYVIWPHSPEKGWDHEIIETVI